MSNDQVITITDDATGASARILPGVGFNCFSLTVPLSDRTIDLIWAGRDFGPESELALHGIPLLFPFAGRFEGTSFSWRGRTYEVAGAMVAGGNVIHGFVISRPWRIVAQTANEVTGEFHAATDDPSLLTQWPADFRIRVTYRIEGRSLVSDIAIDNPDDKPLPFGFGTHPYFRMPFGIRRKDHDSAVVFDAERYWVHDGSLPTGEQRERGAAEDFTNGQRFDEIHWDGVTTGLVPSSDGLCHIYVKDTDSGYTIDQSFPPDFQNIVVWVPPHLEAIALEPWTTVPNAFALDAEGFDTGMIVLGPGEAWRTRITIAFSE